MAGNNEEVVLEFVTDTVAEYTNLHINVRLSGVASLSNELEVLFVPPCLGCIW